MIKCKHCGKSIHDGARFCAACGSPIVSDSASAHNKRTKPKRRFQARWLFIVVCVLVAIAITFVAINRGFTIKGLFPSDKKVSAATIEDWVFDSLYEVVQANGTGDTLMDIIVSHCSIEVSAWDFNKENTAEIKVSNRDIVSVLDAITEENAEINQAEFLEMVNNRLEDAQSLEAQFNIEFVETESGYAAQIDMVFLDACLGGFISYADEMLAETETLDND